MGGDVMEFEFEGMAARGLRRYARMVEQALGLGSGGHIVQSEPPVSIYLPLVDRLDLFPDRDVALVWDDRHGWAAGVENRVGDDLTVLASLTTDVLPTPRQVARFVERIFVGELLGHSEPHTFPDAGDLSFRLSAYAQPAVLNEQCLKPVDQAGRGVPSR